jgi:flagellar biosynthesis/type III secretory pathway protein FliH
MDLIAYFDSQIASIQEAKQAHLDAVALAKEEGKLEGDVDGYKRGYEEGKAAIELPAPVLEDGSVNPEAIYTQAQMNDAVNTGKEEVRFELQPQIDAMSAQLAEVKAELEALKAVPAVDVEAEKAAAVAALKKEIAGKIRNSQIDDLALAQDLDPV